MSIEEYKDKIICGDNIEVLKKIPDSSVDCVITSPPYDDMRNYNNHLKGIKDEYNGYSFKFEALADELFRVSKKGGVVVWVVNDAVIKGGETGTSFRQALYFMSLGFKLHDTMIYEKNGSPFPARRDGNRYSQVFEYMFVFSKKEKPKTAKLIADKPNRWVGYTTFGKGSYRDKDGNLKQRVQKPIPSHSPRNNIWKMNTGKGYSTKDAVAHKHPAIFPEELVDGHLRTWTNEGDIVLDPFNGSGTTTKLSKMLNRHYIGIDIDNEYCKIAKERLKLVEDNNES